MSDAWGGYKNGQIPLSKMLKVEGNYFEPNVGHLVISALAEIRSHGVKIRINEGYRQLGVPADAQIRDERKTSTGGSNQWFQYGRMKRGETPTAAYPGSSIHGWGKALDVSPGRDNDIVRAAFARNGFTFNISSESWHASFTGVPKPIAEPNALQKRNWKLMQSYLRAWGYSGPIDGVAGPKTWTAMQNWLKARHGYTGVIDGVPGPLTYAALKRAGSSLH